MTTTARKTLGVGDTRTAHTTHTVQLTHLCFSSLSLSLFSCISCSFALLAASQAIEKAALIGFGDVVKLGVWSGNVDVAMICDCEVESGELCLCFAVFVKEVLRCLKQRLLRILPTISCSLPKKSRVTNQCLPLVRHDTRYF